MVRNLWTNPEPVGGPCRSAGARRLRWCPCLGWMPEPTANGRAGACLRRQVGEGGAGDGWSEVSLGDIWDSSRAWCQASGGRAHPVGELPAGASPYELPGYGGERVGWCSDWYGDYPSGSVSNPSAQVRFLSGEPRWVVELRCAARAAACPLRQRSRLLLRPSGLPPCLVVAIASGSDPWTFARSERCWPHRGRAKRSLREVEPAPYSGRTRSGGSGRRPALWLPEARPQPGPPPRLRTSSRTARSSNSSSSSVEPARETWPG